MKTDQAFNLLSQGHHTDGVFEHALPEVTRLVRGYLTWYGIHEENLEDLAQDVLVSVYVHIRKMKIRSIPGTRSWLRTICRNAAIDQWRRARHALPVGSQAWDVSEDPEQNDLMEAMAHCLSHLREPDCTVFRLRYGCDWSISEIARVFQWSRRRADLVLTRAREAMAVCLRQQGCDE